MKEVMAFLKHGTTRTLAIPEFSEFWKSLTSEDKLQFAKEVQGWNGESFFA